MIQWRGTTTGSSAHMTGTTMGGIATIVRSVIEVPGGLVISILILAPYAILESIIVTTFLQEATVRFTGMLILTETTAA